MQTGELVSGRWGDILSTRTDKAAVVAVALVLLDGVMTLPNWHLEGNPIVLSLGPEGMIAVKVLASAVWVAVWFLFVSGTRSHRLGATFVWALLGLYTFVVVNNVAVLSILHL